MRVSKVSHAGSGVRASQVGERTSKYTGPQEEPDQSKERQVIWYDMRKEDRNFNHTKKKKIIIII